MANKILHKFTGTILNKGYANFTIAFNSQRIYTLLGNDWIYIENAEKVEIIPETSPDTINDIIILPGVKIATGIAAAGKIIDEIDVISIKVDTIISLLQDIKTALGNLLTCCNEVASNTAP